MIGCFYDNKDEDIKLLRQMQWNCIHLKAYKDEKAIKKAEAIENILNRDEERKLRIKLLETKLFNIRQEIKENCILKSKMREKLIELEEKSKHCAISDLPEYLYKIQVIKELLGE